MFFTTLTADSCFAETIPSLLSDSQLDVCVGHNELYEKSDFDYAISRGGASLRVFGNSDGEQTVMFISAGTLNPLKWKKTNVLIESVIDLAVSEF